MRLVAGILSIAVLMWFETANAQKTYSISVSRHRDVPALTDSDVREILADASAMLQKNSRRSSNDDVACNVTFTFKGPVRTFDGVSKIVDRNNIAAVHRVDSNVPGDAHVKVVEAIEFCRKGRHGPFEGCSYSPPDFRSMIVVHPDLHKDAQGQPRKSYPDHLLWAHEFGHLTGLGHRLARLALMTPCSLAEFSGLPDSSVQVNRAECRCLLSGPASCPLPGPVNCPAGGIQSRARSGQ